LSRKITHSHRLRILDTWIKTSGIKRKVTFHVGRHTNATLLLTYGENIYTVSKLMGHSSVAITERYGKIISTKKTEAVNRIPRIISSVEMKTKENNPYPEDGFWQKLTMKKFDDILRETWQRNIPDLA
jgi:hypothetical protein